MSTKEEISKNAGMLAELTFSLLATCQEKESRLAEQHGLTQAEFRCLRLFGTEECLNNKSIAERMSLSPSRLTRIIDRLVKKEYIVREINNTDRRNMCVSLSAKGVEMVRLLNQSYLDIHKEILENIDESQHTPLITAMTSLLTALKKWVSKP
ncbi:MAG: MarR family transcriptional regulator [Ignavibacteriaceae bacterium]|nr:MarR family transcriptional regulator [Ignavibacteriaceae bacterium]